MSGVLPNFLVCCTITLPLYFLFWLAQVKSKNANNIDVLWSLSIPLILLLFTLRQSEPFENPQSLGFLLISIWSLRLAAHLVIRSQGQGEDRRFRSLRLRWQNQSTGLFFLFYLGHWVLSCVFAFFILPVFLASPAWHVWHKIAFAVGLVFITLESIADYQLYRFRQNPLNRGKLLRSGLWRWSRHPNYFFEWLHWCAYPLLAIGTPWAFLTLLAPVSIYFLLTRLTGIPGIESAPLTAERERYVREVSAFFPKHRLSHETAD